MTNTCPAYQWPRLVGANIQQEPVFTGADNNDGSWPGTISQLVREKFVSILADHMPG